MGCPQQASLLTSRRPLLDELISKSGKQRTHVAQAASYVSTCLTTPCHKIGRQATVYALEGGPCTYREHGAMTQGRPWPPQGGTGDGGPCCKCTRHWGRSVCAGLLLVFMLHTGGQKPAGLSMEPPNLITIPGAAAWGARFWSTGPIPGSPTPTDGSQCPGQV